MRKITLTHLNVRNFKGIKTLSIDFNQETSIFGANGTGKTSVFDAFTWLLYGKNSIEQSDFNIKTLDKDNQFIPKLEHEVEGFFDVDGNQVYFKRLYTEKWTTKRGNDFEELTGHETSYFINDVPISLAEYKLKISELLEESISKIITNPLFFNERMKWTERREILQNMAGEVSSTVILDSLTSLDNKFAELTNLLNIDADLNDEKLKIGAKKKKLKEEIALIPARLDEADRMKPQELNWSELEDSKAKINEDIAKIEASILDKNNSLNQEREKNQLIENKKFELVQKVNQLNQELSSKTNDLKNENNNKISSLRSKISTLKSEQLKFSEDTKRNDSAIKMLVESNNEKRNLWKTENEKTFQFDELQVCCPTCKRELDNAEDKKSELQANFNSDKLKKLAELERQGSENKASIKILEDQISFAQKSFTEKESEINDLNYQISELEKLTFDNPEPTKEIIDLQNEIKEIVIPEIKAVDTLELNNQKTELKAKLQEIEAKLFERSNVEKSEARIKELTEQQKTLSQELATLEKVEFQIDSFNKAKSTIIENRVNDKFALVKFKMFEKQINGGDNPICECSINGVPYNDLNTASKLNAGLDIINALQYHYGIMAPIFIDGRESITEIQKMDCQVINLIVDDKCKELSF